MREREWQATTFLVAHKEKPFSKAATFSENDVSLEKQSDADRSISRPKSHEMGEQINQTTFYHLKCVINWIGERARISNSRRLT